MARRRASRFLLLAPLLVVLAMGCGSDDEDGGGGATPSGEALETRVRESAEQAREQLEELPQQSQASESDSLLSSAGAQATNETMEQFLTRVIQNVDPYWTRTLAAAGVAENQVLYKWMAPGESVTTKCTDASGQPETTSDRTAAYCQADDTIYFSQQFAVELWNGTVNAELPGSSQGYGKSVGDFAVAYVVAHEYAHSVQQQLGLYDAIYKRYPNAIVQDRPFELQADCMAGMWANSVYHQGLLEQGDVEEALDAALAVGDFGFTEKGFHGTPEERHTAWRLGYDSGNAAECNRYLNPENISVAQPEDAGGGVVIIGGG